MKKKLELKKKTISILSNDDLKIMNGGVEDAGLTTSFGNCTGFTCCDDTSGSYIVTGLSWIAISIILASTVCNPR